MNRTDYDVITGFRVQAIIYERESIDRYYKYFRDVFYDIGAHRGLWTLAALMNGVRFVIAFDDNTSAMEQLRQNVIRLQDQYMDKIVHPVNQFITDIEHMNDGPLRTTIDHFINNNKVFAPGFMKIDVEGYEMEVLRGASQTIKSFRPYIMVEAHEYIHCGIKNEIRELLTGLGYSEPEVRGPLSDDHSVIYHMFFM